MLPLRLPRSWVLPVSLPMAKPVRLARDLAAFRGPNPVLAICYKEKLQRWLNLSYGIIPIHQKDQVSTKAMFTAAVRMLRQKGYLGEEDKIAYLSGSFGEGGGNYLRRN